MPPGAAHAIGARAVRAVRRSGDAVPTVALFGAELGLDHIVGGLTDSRRARQSRTARSSSASQASCSPPSPHTSDGGRGSVHPWRWRSQSPPRRESPSAASSWAVGIEHGRQARAAGRSALGRRRKRRTRGARRAARERLRRRNRAAALEQVDHKRRSPASRVTRRFPHEHPDPRALPMELSPWPADR